MKIQNSVIIVKNEDKQANDKNILKLGTIVVT